MADVPARPKTIPPKAVWNAEDGEWELSVKNARGERNGLAKFWRTDGSLCNECSFKEGKPQGPFKRYHNDGTLSQEGQFVAGQLHGTRTWHACDGPTEEQTAAEGMSDKVRRSEMDYDHGRVTAVRHFDAQGRRVLATGEPYPERPALVPDEADFQPEVGWVLVALDAEGQRHGDYSCWGPAGTLVESSRYEHGAQQGPSRTFHPNGKKSAEGEYVAGHKEGVWREFDEAGQVVRETSWIAGALTGPCLDRGVAGQYQDPAIAIERGSFEDDLAVGSWSLLDAKNKPLVRKDLGKAPDAARLEASAVLANDGRSAEDWLAAGEDALGAKSPGEALLAAARAVACSASVRAFLDVHGEVALPRSQAHAVEVAQSLAHAEAPLPILVNGLVRGGAAGPLLRQIAVRLHQEGKARAALDFVNAAILLEPEAPEYLYTRALILMSLGLEELALDDARERGASDAKEAKFLAAYANALFPRFDFWPAREKPRTTYDGLPDAPAQPAAQVRAVFLKYLTRLGILRDAQRGFLADGVAPAWLLPDLSGLLPKGPVRLEEQEFEIADEDGEGHPVAVDERMLVGGLGLTEVQCLARADWTALGWLCWSCGLGEVAMPRAVAAPAEFGQAAGMALQRLWRARDRRVTGGAVARREKTPGFTWEGVDIDALHPGLVSMCENEYAEMAAMFRWLTDEKNRSPWQDNLRDS